MSSGYKTEVIEAAYSYIGSPFRHHFKPKDLCDGGLKTEPVCMEIGMDQTGFDCSGFVIASICLAVGSDPREWDPEYRHVLQLRTLEERRSSAPGDIVLPIDNVHIGISPAEGRIIHASRIFEKVEEESRSRLGEVRVIPLGKMLRAGLGDKF